MIKTDRYSMMTIGKEIIIRHTLNNNFHMMSVTERVLSAGGCAENGNNQAITAIETSARH